MRLLLLCFGRLLATALAVSACLAVPAPTAGAALGPAVPADAGPSRLVVKLRPDARACLSCALRRGRTLGALVPGSRLDELNARFGAAKAQRLFSGTPASRQGLRSRFAQRSTRAGDAENGFGLSRIWLVELADRQLAEQAAGEYARDPAVEYAEVDRTLRVQLLPNDPYLATTGSWGQSFEDLWGLTRIHASTAWETTSGAGVVVAVADTGIDATHPDLAANIWVNSGEIAGNAVDDDGNGYIDDVHGYDFADGDSDPVDDHLHGTHVAGTIAAVAGNGRGIAGVAFSAKVMAVRVLDTNGSGSSSRIAEGIVYAVDNGADVINASFGGRGRSSLLGDAIDYAHDNGVVVVTAAGNDAMDSADFTPANEPGALTISAYNSADEPASFSNYGVKLDLAAPGGGDAAPPAAALSPAYSILSLLSSAVTLPAGSQQLQVAPGYLRLAGTSMAAPHVSAVAALVLALHPDWSVEEVRQALRTGARDVGTVGPDVRSGYGFVDAAGAVGLPRPLIAHIAAPASGIAATAATFDIVGSAMGSGFESYTLELGSGLTPTSWTTVVGPVAAPVENGLLGVVALEDLLDGSYVVRLTSRRGAETFTDRISFSIGSAALVSPTAHAAIRAGGLVEIYGTAAGAGFTSYTVEVRRPAIDENAWSSAGIVRTSPNLPVRGGPLATFDTSGLTRGDRYDFRLRVFNANGMVERIREGVVLDPTLRQGWPRSIAPVADYQYLTVADLGRDGTKEILVGSGDQVQVFKPDGTSRFGWPQSVRGNFPGSTTLGSPIVADVTGDGDPEVIATNRYEVFVWDSFGEQLPGFPVRAMAFSGVAAFLTAGDLDGDGIDDILCSGANGSQALHGDGTEVGGWFWRPDLNDSAIAIGDIDGDGRVESALYNYAYNRTVRRGTLALRDPARLALPGWPRRVRAGLYHPRVQMADMDGDGRLDLFMMDETESHRLAPRGLTAAGSKLRLTRISRRSLCAAPGAACNPHTNNLVSFADLDGNGAAEAYLYLRTNAEAPFADGFGQFQRIAIDDRSRPAPPLVHQYLQPVLYPQSTAIADIDGDGQQELVNGFSGEEPFGRQRLAVVVADADGNLHPQFPKPVPQVILQVGEENDAPSIGLPSVDDRRYATPAVADLDGDGLKEVVWVDPLLFQVFVWNVAGTPGPEVADWPMYAHDAKHTGTLPAAP